MNRKFFNYDYFSMWREIPILLFFELAKKEGEHIHNGKILIVNPCLIGEFAASIPAIVDFIKRNKDKKVDLLVTPQLEGVAQKIVGIGEVFVTKSVYIGRNKEKRNYREQEFDRYEKILVLRASELTYSITLDIESTEVVTSFSEMIRYVGHLIYNLIAGRNPKRWSTLNFDILGGIEQTYMLEEMFHFTAEDQKKIELLQVIDHTKKMLVVHVGTKWHMKRWENDRWVAVLNKINATGEYNVVFVGGKEDIGDFVYISERLTHKAHSLINQIDLGDLILFLSKAQYFIGIDSGPSNIAHLVNLRSITLSGPGPHMYIPTDVRDIFIDKTGGRGLFQLLFAVRDSYIKRISVDEVYNAFNQLQKNKR